jgi:catalase
MNGYSSHTFKLVDAQGNFHYCKWHFKTDQGIKNLDAKKAGELAGSDPDYAQRDLFGAISRGDFPSWSVYVQVMPPKDAATYRWNPFDVTKVWPHKDYPLIPVGKMTLNRNPENYHAEVEQSAFSPSHLVPGMDVSNDKMLQGRLFSYPDTHRYRLGKNYLQLPINCPHATKVFNHQRDGAFAIHNGGSAPNYEPNSFSGPKQTNVTSTYTRYQVSGDVARHVVDLVDDDFVQAGNLYRIMTADQKKRLVDNIVGHLKNAKKFIQERQVKHFKRADAEYGARIEEGLRLAARS